MIGAVKSWYPRSGVLARNRNGVERRAVELPGEYKRPLAKLDAKYHGTLANHTGLLVRRLEGYGRLQGLVVGLGRRVARTYTPCWTSLLISR